MQHFVNILLGLLTFAVLQILGVWILCKLTKYDEQEELKKGNKAVGIMLRGEIIATSIILCVSAYTNHNILDMTIWFVVGYLCLFLSFILFDFLTKKIKISDEIGNGNVAVAQMLEGVLIGTAILVSSLII
jgi:putative membrane protein